MPLTVHADSEGSCAGEMEIIPMDEAASTRAALLLQERQPLKGSADDARRASGKLASSSEVCF